MTFFIACSILFCFMSNAVANLSIPRCDCYPEDGFNCNESFLDVYPEVSQSATNNTKADSYYFLFNKTNPDRPVKVHNCGGKLPENYIFNASSDLIVLFMPFIAGMCTTAVYRDLVNQILLRENYVLVVDDTWGNNPDYYVATLNIRIVAKQTAIVIQNIQRQTNITRNQLHFIGQFMGAQTCALTAKYIRPRKITAISPALYGFTESVPIEDRLDPSDADEVQALHCTIGSGCLPHLGVNYTVGHADVYINIGVKESQCYNYALEALAKGDILPGIFSLAVPTFCPIIYCIDFLKTSINPKDCQYIGVECDNEKDFNSGKCSSCGDYGENCAEVLWHWTRQSPLRKKYYLRTKPKCDYCDNSWLELQGFSDKYKESLKRQT